MTTLQARQRTILGAILREQGRRQRWLAQKVGMDESLLARILHLERPCSPDLANRIAAVLSLPVSAFYRNGGLSTAIATIAYANDAVSGKEEANAEEIDAS